ncbi:MAG: hypothetical protein U0930_03635 [Pirellulales bacterium]
MPGLPAIDDLPLRLKIQNRKTQEMFAEQLVLRKRINSIVGSGSGPVLIKIQTDGAHNLSDGDKIIIAGALINASDALHEANGYWTITSTATNEFTLNGSTFSNTYGGGGSVYDGVSYAVNFPTAPASSGALLIANIKKLLGGSFLGTKQVIKQVTVDADVEWMRADASFEQALLALVVTNNSGATISGSLKMRTTKALGNIVQAFAPFTLLSNHSMTLSGESLRWQFDASGLPKVS